MGAADAQPAELKIRENRLRRMARRQGLVLHKSRMRDPQAYQFGTYGLVDPETDNRVPWVPLGGKGTVPPKGDPAGTGGYAYGMTLDEIDAWLHTPRPATRSRLASQPPGPWTTEGLTPEQLARGMWRCLWTDEAGVAHDVLAVPIVGWPPSPTDAPHEAR